jgi:hypothetical protein
VRGSVPLLAPARLPSVLFIEQQRLVFNSALQIALSANAQHAAQYHIGRIDRW